MKKIIVIGLITASMALTACGNTAATTTSTNETVSAKDDRNSYVGIWDYKEDDKDEHIQLAIEKGGLGVIYNPDDEYTVPMEFTYEIIDGRIVLTFILKDRVTYGSLELDETNQKLIVRHEIYVFSDMKIEPDSEFIINNEYMPK